jgi:hypothetical protein
VADGEQVRIELGFEGGQVVVAFVDAASAGQLERALHEDGPRVITLESEEGPYHVVVPSLAYVKRFSRSGRVGFGSR